MCSMRIMTGTFEADELLRVELIDAASREAHSAGGAPNPRRITMVALPSVKPPVVSSPVPRGLVDAVERQKRGGDDFAHARHYSARLPMSDSGWAVMLASRHYRHEPEAKQYGADRHPCHRRSHRARRRDPAGVEAHPAHHPHIVARMFLVFVPIFILARRARQRYRPALIR
jgi:hypothetical protein